MIDALKRGDKAAALSCFMDRHRYEDILSDMDGKLPALAASLSSFHLVDVGPKTASGVVNQTVDGVTSRQSISFLFINGNWLVVEL